MTGMQNPVIQNFAIFIRVSRRLNAYGKSHNYSQHKSAYLFPHADTPCRFIHEIYIIYYKDFHITRQEVFRYFSPFLYIEASFQYF